MKQNSERKARGRLGAATLLGVWFLIISADLFTCWFFDLPPAGGVMLGYVLGSLGMYLSLDWLDSWDDRRRGRVKSHREQ